MNRNKMRRKCRRYNSTNRTIPNKKIINDSKWIKDRINKKYHKKDKYNFLETIEGLVREKHNFNEKNYNILNLSENGDVEEEFFKYFSKYQNSNDTGYLKVNIGKESIDDGGISYYYFSYLFEKISNNTKIFDIVDNNFCLPKNDTEFLKYVSTNNNIFKDNDLVEKYSSLGRIICNLIFRKALDKDEYRYPGNPFPYIFWMILSGRYSFIDCDQALTALKEINHNEYESYLTILNSKSDIKLMDLNVNNFLNNNNFEKVDTIEKAELVIKQKIERDYIHNKLIAWYYITDGFYSIRNQDEQYESGDWFEYYLRYIISNCGEENINEIKDIPRILRDYITVEKKDSNFDNIEKFFIKSDSIPDGDYENYNNFIDIIKNLDIDYKKKLIEFCGYKYTNNQIKIKVAYTEPTNLCNVRTCFNLFEIPKTDKENLKIKLLQSIDNCEFKLFFD